MGNWKLCAPLEKSWLRPCFSFKFNDSSFSSLHFSVNLSLPSCSTFCVVAIIGVFHTFLAGSCCKFKRKFLKFDNGQLVVVHFLLILIF